MMLSNEQIDHFKRLLKRMKAELMDASETGEQAEAVVELDQTRVGRLSRMDAMQAQAMSVETGRRRRQQLRDIEVALGRIDAGDYGACMECGEDIAPARLNIDPAANLCIICAEALE